MVVTLAASGCAGIDTGSGSGQIGESRGVQINGQPVKASLTKVIDPLVGPGINPDKGWRFIGLKMRYNNHSSQMVEFQPVEKLKLMAAWRPLSPGRVDGGECATEFAFGIQIAPNSYDAGCVVFEAPIGIKPSSLQMQSGTGNQKVTWKLH